MASQAAVINATLHHLGESESSDPLASTDAWVRRVRNRLDERARACMEEHPGNFCMSVELLAASEPTPIGWAYGFDKPGGAYRCLRIVKVTDSEASMDRRGPSIRYEDRGGRICSDYESTYLKFVDGNYASNFGAWPAKFADYVAADVAFRVMPATEGSSIKMREITAVRLEAKRAWKNWDAQQNPTFEPPPSRWQVERFSRGGRSGGWRDG